MGLFDEVFCERILPDGLDGKGRVFQTKDFPDPYMDKYRITTEGRLVLEEGHSVVVPENERRFHNPPERRFVKTGEKDLNYHGYLNFYKSVGKAWHEYRAKFTDGNLVSIEVCERE